MSNVYLYTSSFKRLLRLGFKVIILSFLVQSLTRVFIFSIISLLIFKILEYSCEIVLNFNKVVLGNVFKKSRVSSLHLLLSILIKRSVSKFLLIIPFKNSLTRSIYVVLSFLISLELELETILFKKLYAELIF